MIDKNSQLSGDVLILDIDEARYYAGLRERLIELQDLGRRFDVRMPAGLTKPTPALPIPRGDICRRYGAQ